jgi:hypothetical protein
MRILNALILILAFLTGQAHACAGLWVLPDGSNCVTCPTEQCVTGSPMLCGKGSQVAKAEKDCHSCCSLKACSDQGESKKAIHAPSIPPAISLPEAPVLTLSVPIVEPRPVHLQIEQGFPNAPPSSRSARAPPFRLS